MLAREPSPAIPTSLARIIISFGRAPSTCGLSRSRWWQQSVAGRHDDRQPFPPESVSHVVWLYSRFPLSLGMAQGMLAACGIIVSHGTTRQGVRKFGRAIVSLIRRHLPSTDDKWHFDEVVIVGGEGWLGRPSSRPASFWTSWSRASVASRRPSRSPRKLPALGSKPIDNN